VGSYISVERRFKVEMVGKIEVKQEGARRVESRDKEVLQQRSRD